MRLPVVPRSELERARSERDEWRRRAASALPGGDSRVSGAGTQARRWARVSRALLAASTLATAVTLGALTLSGGSDAALGPDYPGCIGKARYESPIAGNQYQELVNALYACGVYELP